MSEENTDLSPSGTGQSKESQKTTAARNRNEVSQEGQLQVPTHLRSKVFTLDRYVAEAEWKVKVRKFHDVSKVSLNFKQYSSRQSLLSIKRKQERCVKK